jgi:hypothetical protein
MALETLTVTNFIHLHENIATVKWPGRKYKQHFLPSFYDITRMPFHSRLMGVQTLCLEANSEDYFRFSCGRYFSSGSQSHYRLSNFSSRVAQL